MTNLMKIEQNLTMTSREIAELTGKRHTDVKRDIETMMEGLELDVSSFARIYIDSMNRQQTEFSLDKEHGLSVSVVVQGMRQSVYAPKPVGMVRNTHESSGGSTYAVYWKKDVSAVFKRFAKECELVGKGWWFKHDWVSGNFKMSVLWCNL